MVGGVGRVIARLFLFPLWLREHYRARHGDVYSVSHCHPGCRRPSISSSSFTGIFFESRRIAYPLWDNTRTYLFCSWVRYAAQVVVDGIARFLNKYSYLGNLRIRLVEVAATLVAGKRNLEEIPDKQINDLDNRIVRLFYP